MRRKTGWVARAAAILVLLMLSVAVEATGVPKGLIGSGALTRQALAQTAPSPEAGPAGAWGAGNEAKNVPANEEPDATPPGATSNPRAAIDCQPAPANAYHSCVYHDALGMELTFYLFFPRDYNPHASYPLVLLLHGGGQRADLNNTDAENRDTLLDDPYTEVWGPGFDGPDSVDVQSRWPSFIVAPQLVFPNRWVDVPPGDGSHPLTPQPSESLRMAKEIVDALRGRYRSIDASRLYITGMSLGGYGTWDAIERWPNYFAAAAPICGAGDPSQAAKLAHLPIWAFHGADDPVVPVSGSRQMVAAIRAAGGHPRYTEYPDVGHGSWVYAYSIAGKPSPTPDLFPWLFAQRKPTAPAS